ncbi:hypothetical protein GCM10010168_77800 [Actinoplanes ianthinogenes]|uniref:Protein kinase domain-containing protein n=1 Tax=Actinoplanes ianthinogenes TaxID=122358 RepID=A0ABN6C2R7_9ACTN|nr:serine/threonine-protein kinase [Actinoplanes ianthinogenes]BCJ39764.1 hypothetical protein Aiant_04210 [Actinoplanes ianthinogenes]GGR47530.1 hypothetical protein GCM10010168_77800 [Actinoplanes ianthinogenes]
MSDYTTRREDVTPGAAATTREGAPATTREGAPATTREGASGPAPTTRESPEGHAGREDSGGLPGAVFARYRPEADLATGGEAHLVMLVRDRETGEQRVAKVYPTAVRPDTALLDALRTADARHVVRVIDWGEESGAYGREMSWEVLEYAPGGSLAALARDHGGPLPPDQVRTVLAQVTEALAYLHGELRHGAAVGMAHRDIKPENILLRGRDPLDLVLCDFGLVAELRATRRTTGRAGTPAYQAPETWWQKSQKPEQDWWSLGVVIVELLTGRNPNSGVGGWAANERAVFEHIATYGVDLDGVTDPEWRLLCQGLLTRPPEERWGATEVRAWLGGERPAVHDAPIVEPAPPAAPPVAPFEVAGRVCRTPEQIGAALSENWAAGIALFENRTQQLDLSDWLRDNFPEVNLPENLMRTKVSHRTDAAARLTRLISWVAPEMPPVYEQRRADAPGLAVLGQSAAAGDPTALALLGNLNVGLLRALARHRCRNHPQCAAAQPGCAVLTEAADRLDQVTAAVQERINELAVRLAGGFGTARRPEVDRALPAAAAIAFRLLVDPDHRERLHTELRRQKAPGKVGWWAALRDEARGTDNRQLAAGAVATALIPVATAESAAEKARQAQAKQERRNERATAAGFAPAPGRTAARNLWRDAVNLLLAVLLAYLTTFAGAAVSKFEAYDLNPGRTPLYLLNVTDVQTMVALPVLIVLGCLLIRPVDPPVALRRARWFCWLFGLAVAIVLSVADGEYRILVRFPIVLRSAFHDPLQAVNGNFAEIFPYAVFGMLIAALWLSRRLVNRGWQTEAGDGGSLVRGIRAALIIAVVVLYLVQPLWVWQQFAVPFLPSPTEVWWQW